MDIVLEDDIGRNMFVGFKLPNQIFEATGIVRYRDIVINKIILPDNFSINLMYNMSSASCCRQLSNSSN